MNTNNINKSDADDVASDASDAADAPDAVDAENEVVEISLDALGDADKAGAQRIIEALLFAAEEPLDVKSISQHLPDGYPVLELINLVQADYAERGVNLHNIGRKFAFRTATDLAEALQKHVVSQRRLSRAGLETLAIIAYHQPVTRAEIEDIRGVSGSKGTLDVLLETEWVRIRGRRRVPGRPVTYGTSDHFLAHFGLEALTDLPGIDELKAAGLLDNRLPPGFAIPEPDPDSDPEEDALEEGDTGEEFLAEPVAADMESFLPDPDDAANTTAPGDNPE